MKYLRHNAPTVLKIVFALALVLFAYSSKSKLAELFSAKALVLQHPHWLVLAGVLVFVNWGIESYKWYLLVNRVEPTTPWGAFKAVLAGVATGIVTPFRSGEFAGRVLYTQPETRPAAATLTIYSGLIQMVVTGLAFFVLMPLLPVDIGIAVLSKFDTLNVILYSVGAIALVTLGLWALNKYGKPYFTMLQQLPLPVFASIFTLSALRYAVFAIQFTLVFMAFGVHSPLTAIYSTVALYYFIYAFIPSFILVDGGLRGALGYLLFIPLTDNATLAIVVPLIIWLLNLLLPAIGGSYFVFTYKRKQKLHLATQPKV